MAMNMGKVVYWHKDQVIIRLKSQPAQVASPPITTAGLFSKLNAILSANHSPQLKLPFDTISLRGPHHPGNSDTLYFAQIDSNMGNDANIVMGNNDNTVAVISHLNANKHTLAANLGSLDIIPHWFWSGTEDTTHGCPVNPPFPVEESGAQGRYKITLPELPDSLQSATGKGVTVFVLDTLPSPTIIANAVGAPGNNNSLLKGIATGMKYKEPYDAMPPAINLNYSFEEIVPDPAHSAMTGKDIYGRLIGFPMADHGLTIAAIVRDLAPAANIECIRVLNDFGVGDVRTLAHALTYIYNRTLTPNPDTKQPGDLVNKPVVINLSLVVMPPGNDIPGDFSQQVKEQITSDTLQLLHDHMQPLADQRAIFIAAAGNDTDPRDTMMNPAEVRFNSRYPAYFAYDERYRINTMIPVGAVNQARKAASYSNYPGPRGIATYGGELPRPVPWMPSAMSHTTTHVDTSEPIDALCGIYTASEYPALSMNDHYDSPSTMPMASASSGTPNLATASASSGMSKDYPTYHAPNSHAWAYYSGTSFATPIISALAARILEQKPESRDLHQAIVSASRGQQTVWTSVADTKMIADVKDESGPMILAMQDWSPEGTSIP
jgi:hypothetical protein